MGERWGRLSGGQRQRIAIAHRLSTIAERGRLLVMDKGRIVEDGAYEALLARGGLYAELA